MGGRFSDEEMRIAKSVDLTAVARSFGYTVNRVGQYHTLGEMDSMRIYNRTNWFRWSNNRGGSQIDFLREICGMDFKEAVTWLLDFAGHGADLPSGRGAGLKNQASIPSCAKRPFTLPGRAKDSQRLYAYLHGRRHISTEVIDHFVNAGLIYESEKYHNIVFVGRDVDGIARYAHVRGTAETDFKHDVAGSGATSRKSTS